MGGGADGWLGGMKGMMVEWKGGVCACVGGLGVGWVWGWGRGRIGGWGEWGMGDEGDECRVEEMAVKCVRGGWVAGVKKK